MGTRAGTRLAPSKGVENEYYNSLRPYAEAMCRTVKSAVKRSMLRYARKDVVATWDNAAQMLARQFALRVQRYTMTAFRESARGLLKNERAVDALKEPKARFVVSGIVRENVRLIRSIPRQYIAKVNTEILSYNDGTLTKRKFEERMAVLADQVFTRLRLIARDQNEKATESFMVLRMEANGLHLVKWVHTHLKEKKPREYHMTKWDGHTGKRNGKPNGLNGYIFDLSKPPVIDKKTGERGYPAQLVNCKCYLVPVVKKP